MTTYAIVKDRNKIRIEEFVHEKRDEYYWMDLEGFTLDEVRCILMRERPWAVDDIMTLSDEELLEREF